MGYICAWCRKAGATRKVELDGDGSDEHYRYFCSPTHQANWETNQPREMPILVAIEAASMWEIIKQANLDSWYLLSLCQYGTRDKLTYRAIFQKRKPTGATTEDFTTYEDAPDPRLAVLAAYQQTRVIERALVTHKLAPGSIPKDNGALPKTLSGLNLVQETRLEKAVDRLWFAVKTNGRRGGNRKDDL